MKISIKRILEEMDDKLGYSMNGLYMDDVIDMLKEEVAKEENWKKIYR